MTPRSVDDVSRLERADFVALVGPAFEGSPWIAEAAWLRRPFASLIELYAAMIEVVEHAGPDAQLALIRAHPDLAGRAAVAGELTEESSSEQVAAGLDRLSPAAFVALMQLNEAYRERFGFPFVVCAREHTPETIIAAVSTRLTHDGEAERRTALAEVAKIARLRLADVVHEEAP